MASVQGTKAFVSRFPKHSARKLAGFNISPFGYGCYRVDHSNEAYKQSMLTAIRGGCNVSNAWSIEHTAVILNDTGVGYILKLYVWTE